MPLFPISSPLSKLSPIHTAKMPESVSKPQTLYDKVLSKHIVDEKLDGTLLLYIGMSATV